MKPNPRPSLSNTERKRVKAKTGGRCHVCGGSLRGKWYVDHVRPRARGGPDREDNYVPCCGICNGARRHRRSRTIRKILQLGAYLLPELKRRTALGKEVVALFTERRKKNRMRRLKRRAAKRSRRR